MKRHSSCHFALLSLFIAALALEAIAEPPQLTPDGELPADSRLEPLTDLDGYFPLNVPTSKARWEIRAESIRRRILVSQGLWPMPEATQLDPVIHGEQEMDGYTLSKVYFESMPGFYVTGVLYKPVGFKGKRPGVLCPHGHWRVSKELSGRFYDRGVTAAQKEIDSGAEEILETARNPIQARCVHLARMGCVVFQYDMLAYADSNQLGYDVVHGFDSQRAHMNTPTGWGLFSPRAESNLQNVMGLQTYNSIRSVDFLQSLPEVDVDRIAVTGASGGGTQTFILSAIDPRIKVSMPAVMVSTAMQGGCTCENTSLLRVGTGNVEFAALFAPKPLGLTAADDWTVEMETKGFPELQKIYKMYDAQENVMLEAHTHFPHNYNLVCRKALYHWFNKHLELGFKEIPEEQPFPFQAKPVHTVWNDEHPEPESGDAFEKKLVKQWHDDAQQQLDQLLYSSKRSLESYKSVVGGGIDIVIGARLPRNTEIDYEQVHKVDKGHFLEIGGFLNHIKNKTSIPILFLYPKEWNQKTVIWISKSGKAGLYAQDGNLTAGIKTLIDQGYTVMGVDLLMQGEFLVDSNPIPKTRRVANPRQAAGYTFGYNSTLFARRVHDVLTVISFVKHHETNPESISLVSLDATGPIAIAARAQARSIVDHLVATTNGFRFHQVDDLHSPEFLPGGAKYHDLPGMLAVAAPSATYVAGEKELPKVTLRAYAASRQADQLQLGENDTAAALEWLMAQ